MKTYARINDGIVVEIIKPQTWQVETDEHTIGDEIAIGDRFHPEFVATLIDITSIDPQPDQHWTYDGKTFAAAVTENEE